MVQIQENVLSTDAGSLFSDEYVEEKDNGSGLLLEVPAPGKVPSFANATVGCLLQ
jgi:hypothetical protein